MGFEEFHTSPCLFRKVVNDEAVVTIVIHVDDLLVASRKHQDEHGSG